MPKVTIAAVVLFETEHPAFSTDPQPPPAGVVLAEAMARLPGAAEVLAVIDVPNAQKMMQEFFATKTVIDVPITVPVSRGMH